MKKIKKNNYQRFVALVLVWLILFKLTVGSGDDIEKIEDEQPGKKNTNDDNELSSLGLYIPPSPTFRYRVTSCLFEMLSNYTNPKNKSSRAIKLILTFIGHRPHSVNTYVDPKIILPFSYLSFYAPVTMIRLPPFSYAQMVHGVLLRRTMNSGRGEAIRNIMEFLFNPLNNPSLWRRSGWIFDIIPRGARTMNFVCEYCNQKTPKKFYQSRTSEFKLCQACYQYERLHGKIIPVNNRGRIKSVIDATSVEEIASTGNGKRTREGEKKTDSKCVIHSLALVTGTGNSYAAEAMVVGWSDGWLTIWSTVDHSMYRLRRGTKPITRITHMGNTVACVNSEGTIFIFTLYANENYLRYSRGYETHDATAECVFTSDITCLITTAKSKRIKRWNLQEDVIEKLRKQDPTQLWCMTNDHTTAVVLGQATFTTYDVISKRRVEYELPAAIPADSVKLINVFEDEKTIVITSTENIIYFIDIYTGTLVKITK